MQRVAIIACKRIKDQLCIACEKCLKAISRKEGEFSRYKDGVQLVALGTCGDCPGLIIPKLKLMKEISAGLDVDYDVIHLGTCVKKAMETANCPMDFESLSKMIKESFGKDLVLGTHPY